MFRDVCALAAALAPDGRCVWHRLNALCQTHTSAGLISSGRVGALGTSV